MNTASLPVKARIQNRQLLKLLIIRSLPQVAAKLIAVVPNTISGPRKSIP